MNIVSVFDNTAVWHLPAIEPWVHLMAVRLTSPSMAVVVASVPFSRDQTPAWFLASRWICASHRPGRPSQEPDDDAEYRETEGSERQDGEGPGNPHPSLQRCGEEVEAIN